MRSMEWVRAAFPPVTCVQLAMPADAAVRKLYSRGFLLLLGLREARDRAQIHSSPGHRIQHPAFVVVVGFTSDD